MTGISGQAAGGKGMLKAFKKGLLEGVDGEAADEIEHEEDGN